MNKLTDEMIDEWAVPTSTVVTDAQIDKWALMGAGAPAPMPEKLKNVKMLKASEGEGLRAQHPEVSGFIKGALGTAPDELGGSVLDETSARERKGLPGHTLRHGLPGPAAV